MAQVFAVQRQKQIYTSEEIAHFERSEKARKYLTRKKTASDNTAAGYRTNVAAFAQWVYRTKNKAELDDFVEDIKNGKLDPYDSLADFISWIKETRKGDLAIKANSLIKMAKVTKRFLKFSKCPVNNEDFREQVSLPRHETIEKKGADKQAVITILNTAQDVRLKTFLMCEAVYGMFEVPLLIAIILGLLPFVSQALVTVATSVENDPNPDALEWPATRTREKFWAQLDLFWFVVIGIPAATMVGIIIWKRGFK